MSQLAHQTQTHNTRDHCPMKKANSSLHPVPSSHRGAVQDSFFDGASFLSPSNGFGPGSNPATTGFAAQIAQLERADFVYRVGCVNAREIWVNFMHPYVTPCPDSPEPILRLNADFLPNWVI